MVSYSLGGSVTLLGLFLCLSDAESMRTLKNVPVKHGGSVTIPCLYDQQYKANSKFWCSGYYWSTCSIVAYANSSGSTSVTDYPSHNIFIVALNPVFDSGTRWCAAEIARKWTPDDRDYLYLTVSQDPDLSVDTSSVRSDEGGSVTVQCLYSAAYKNTPKQWCRFRDEACYTVGKTETSQNSAVSITDDGRSFSVEMSEMKKSDAGWYWCRAGDLQVPVHIRVGDESPGQPINQNENKTPLNDTMLALCVIAGLLLLLILVGLVIWKLKKKQIATNKEYGHNLINDDVVYDAVFVGHPQSAPNQIPKAREDAVTYSIVTDGQSKVSPVPSIDKVIYSAVKHQ